MAAQIGVTGGDLLAIEGEQPLLLARLRQSFEGWLPAYMAGTAVNV
jgi:phosphoribosylformylglycinamidine synthase